MKSSMTTSHFPDMSTSFIMRALRIDWHTASKVSNAAAMLDIVNGSKVPRATVHGATHVLLDALHAAGL